MKSRALLFAALCSAAPVALAQDDKKPDAPKMPEPRVKQHDALKALAGDWQTAMKMEAMPGVPGMEKAAESKGTERAELICNGLWLKVAGEGTWQGEPMQGVWLLGYDPHQKKYVCIMACSADDQSACVMDGSYDEKSKTWTFQGKTPQGEMRSTMAFSDADTSVETCYMKGADGKEAKCMEITRTRAKGAAKGGTPAEASAKKPKAPAKEQEALLKEVGDWEATVKSAMAPDQPPVESKGSESSKAICNGRWIWTDFKGQFMGAPFEGHALYGFDPVAKKYVGFWIDSGSPTHARTSGSAASGAKSYTLEGNCVDESGKPMTIKEVVTWKDDNTRVQEMEFKGGAKSSTMTITYTRKTKQ